jgi:hypothetical protein
LLQLEEATAVPILEAVAVVDSTDDQADPE